MELIKQSPKMLVLRIPANESLANAIRRSISEVSSLAIDEVEIFKNDSALYDEMLAHRFGLVPLKTEKGMSSKTKISLKLSKVGPCTVYSGDLEGPASIVYENMPMTILGEGHKLELVATAILGKGTEHAKYTPGLGYYRHLLEVKSSPEIDTIIQKSNGLIKPEKKGSKWICDLNDSLIEDINKIDSDAVKDSDEMIFVIESYGMMDAKDIFIKSIDALKSNLKDFGKSLK